MKKLAQFFTVFASIFVPTVAFAQAEFNAAGMTWFLLWGMLVAITCNAFLSMLVKLVVVRSIAGGPNEPVVGFIKATLLEATAWFALIFIIIIGIQDGWAAAIPSRYQLVPLLACITLAWLINRELIERNQAGALTGTKFIGATVLTVVTPALLFIFQFGITRFLTSPNA
jgi:hypothetical protein